MKISIIVPVYYSEQNLPSLYSSLKENFIEKLKEGQEYEIVMVDDGSNDNSYNVMEQLSKTDSNIRIIKLSRNFGSHAAILCGLSNCTGNCAVVKAADLQEPTEMILEMVQLWEKGNNVVLAVREDREEPIRQTFFANLYYRIVKRFVLPQMPKTGFDIFLIDRKVISVLEQLDEKNSALTGQILWSGFKTATVKYKRLARQIGTSKWTLRKKIKLVTDTLFSFTYLPITIVSLIGCLSFMVATFWGITVLVLKLNGTIEISGWTTLFLFNLLSFGITMITLGIIGEYLWRTFDSARNRPVFIIEEKNF